MPQAVIQGLVGGETGGLLLYRWFDWNGIGLFDWQPVIDGRASLDLGYLSGMDIGNYPFTQEVTNCNITVNDQMVLSVENWLRLFSPADGSEFQLNEGSIFVWDSSYTQFKVQFGKVEGQFTHTFPKKNDVWLNAPSFTLDKEQASDLNEHSRDDEGADLLYWRVFALDETGNVKISEARHIVLPQ